MIQRAADAGSAEGQHRLALVFINGDAGVPRNPARAVELLREGRGSRPPPCGRLNLGTIYLRGQGVQRDLIQARAWLEQAAADGDAYATYALGRAMAENAPPASADLDAGRRLFRRAAEKRSHAGRGSATAWRWPTVRA